MPSVSRAVPVSFSRALAGAFLAALVLVLAVVPAVAAPAVDPFAPRLLAIDYLAQQSPGGGSSDSGTVYAKMWTPTPRTGAVHLHGGVFAPIQASATSAMLGLRIAGNMGRPLLVGFMTGWTYNSKSLLEPVSTGLQGFEPNTVLATVNANLVPAMVFMQVTLTEKYFLVPYVGVAAGYEWLILQAKDYRTDADSSLTYGNWAWQWHAGMGLKVSNSMRLDTEVFYNGGSLARDVYDVNGVRRRETVDVDGAGARIGLHLAY